MSYYHCHLQVRNSKSERLSGLMRSTWPACGRVGMRVCRAAHSWRLYIQISLIKIMPPSTPNRNTSHYYRKFCAISLWWGRCEDWFNSLCPNKACPEFQKFRACSRPHSVSSLIHIVTILWQGQCTSDPSFKIKPSFIYHSHVHSSIVSIVFILSIVLVNVLGLGNNAVNNFESVII